jgi:hypothetical protein
VQSSVPDDVVAAGHVYGVDEVVVAAAVGVALATGAAVLAVAVAVALERGEAVGAVAGGVVAAPAGEGTPDELPPLHAGDVIATTSRAANQSDLEAGIVFLFNGAKRGVRSLTRAFERRSVRLHRPA